MSKPVENLLFSERGDQKGSSSFDDVANVAIVPHRSPFRYPGGKTWFVPYFRQWSRHWATRKRVLVEPFAGGAIVGLTAGFEDLYEHVVLCELDDEVAAVWRTILGDKSEWLQDRILNFEMSFENVLKTVQTQFDEVHEIAFRTIVKNRCFHGGILAKGSGLLKSGENGKGVASRWYARTLANRIRAISIMKRKFTFIQEDAFNVIHTLSAYEDHDFFIDPPYVLAGRRLYNLFEIDHEKLISISRSISGHFLITYDKDPMVESIATKYLIPLVCVPMKTTHHLKKYEIVLTDNVEWFS